MLFVTGMGESSGGFRGPSCLCQQTFHFQLILLFLFFFLLCVCVCPCWCVRMWTHIYTCAFRSHKSTLATIPQELSSLFFTARHLIGLKLLAYTGWVASEPQGAASLCLSNHYTWPFNVSSSDGTQVVMFV